MFFTYSKPLLVVIMIFAIIMMIMVPITLGRIIYNIRRFLWPFHQNKKNIDNIIDIISSEIEKPPNVKAPDIKSSIDKHCDTLLLTDYNNNNYDIHEGFMKDSALGDLYSTNGVNNL